VLRLIAIDLGDKRTGVAAGDTHTRIVSPIEVIETPITSNGGEELLRQLAKVIEEHAPARVVMGLPLNMDGTEGPAAAKARAFGARLAGRIKPEVVYHDERLSSADADWTMAGSGMTHKQKKLRRDALAAASILRGYLGTLPMPDFGEAQPENA
jgi:putative Holliday junction resolvase